MATIHLAGGCFWGLEKYLSLVNGVVATDVGYANGTTGSPSYEEVCTGRTGHAETVRVEYDPAIAPLPFLLEVFYEAVDPVAVDRQGNDVGTQYRSAIFFTDPDHQDVAEDMLYHMGQDKLFGAPIVTEVQPLVTYWPAEDYHQNYFRNHPNQGYCTFVVGPKLEKFRKTFARYLKPGA